MTSNGTMRVGMVFDDDYPWDVRVEKIGRALRQAGHEVFLACRNRTRNPTVEESVEPFQVRRMHPWRFLPGAVDVGLMFPAFFSPRWLAHIRRMARRDRCDALLVRDLPLAMAGLRVGRQIGRPVVIDLAENYPAALAAFQRHNGRRPADLLVRNPSFAARLERRVAREADHILVVCDEMRDRILDLGAMPARVSVVSNTPELARFRAVEPPAEVIERYADRFVLLYVGEVSPYRGLATVVETLPTLRESISNVLLVIVGRGPGLEPLRRLGEELGVSGQIDLPGFLPHDRLAGYIARGDVCLIPHLRTEHVDTTLPNKLFEYMALGRPVLATDAPPMERIIRETGCGGTYRSGDAADLARAVLEMTDPTRRRERGERGREAVRSRYNWTRESEVLLRAFDPDQLKAPSSPAAS